MDLLPSSEQEEIVASSAAFLASALPSERTRQLIGDADNVDAKAWRAAADQGWFVLGLPPDLGGVGCGLADEVLLFREIGRSLASGPFLATTLAVRVAAFGGDPRRAGEIGRGGRVGMGVFGPGGTLDAGGLNGEVHVIDGNECELVLVATPERAALFSTADLGDVVAVECIDPTTRLARTTASGVQPVVAVAGDIDPVGLRGSALVAAQLTGIAEATAVLSAEHAKDRIQFGRPIGVNQAIKHPCADMAVRAELAWAQTAVGALALDEGRPDAELQCLSALVVSADAAERNAAATVQVLGGMGFTFEHDANLYVKRAFLLAQLLGTMGPVLERLVRLPGPE